MTITSYTFSAAGSLMGLSIDRAWPQHIVNADNQIGAGAWYSHSSPSVPGDLRLLRREHPRAPGPRGRGAARPRLLTGGLQLAPGPFSERGHAHGVEHAVDYAQARASRR